MLQSLHAFMVSVIYNLLQLFNQRLVYLFELVVREAQ